MGKAKKYLELVSEYEAAKAHLEAIKADHARFDTTEEQIYAEETIAIYAEMIANYTGNKE